MTVTVHPAAALAGSPVLPADKSVAHRAAIFAAIAEGESQIIGFSDAADPHSTLACLRALGVEIEERPDVLGADGTPSLFVQGRGLGGLRPAPGVLDCGNSGTTMRLLMGLLAGRPFDTTLTGDASLSGRPMERVAAPLRQMGGAVDLSDGGAPVGLRGRGLRGRGLRGITYRLPVASAQVKSAVLLAGLSARGTTTVVEPVPTRDHTERMLELDVLDVGGERHVSVEGGAAVRARRWVVPRDVSAAAFFLVAGSTAEAAVIQLSGVGLNPTRSGVLDVLRAMGATIKVSNERERGGEPIADLRVEAPGGLAGVEIGGAIVPNLIDEIPALAVAAAYAEGQTVIRDAAELRVKETDRIAATAAFLRAMGGAVTERPDGLVVDGGRPLHGATVDARGDHRIAMAAAVAALGATGPTTIRGAEAAAVSFPGFWEALEGVAVGSVEHGPPRPA
ncbi:3-phosphoshikimate 1-carboxyvinyltransferase [Rubrivirga litoralis]|uniref:3-phosphoshikimate 1-carboxyvinyltransferase n=1 Tax=Rubrivirga litoralis TaxID=3075598 RepID=A0ABU3BU64_9BACT|nr:3-phosphoshikimate 1-carboxyvinyltransferase [Rubrivirga sp. F394]MDT0632833.1 3-phosphoshikimate 1-carboxyvinyltransferase [Rubrivirga sp. F394]